jgi:hypothetical protein
LARDAINRALRRVMATEPMPDIRWDDVVGIDALGHDAIGPFEVCVNFTYSDGTSTAVYVHNRGYEDLFRTLHERFPSISPTWYDEMMSDPDWHVERRLYHRDGA